MSTFTSKYGKTLESVLGQCTKATLLGNNISVRMLEFLTTVKSQPHDFRTLAHDFLDIARVLWSIEAGLSECFRTRQVFPDDMIRELEIKFRRTISDFQVLDRMLFKFLEYEKRGAMGKLQRGWHLMFADKDVAKMRESIGKTRDSLKISALVFQWSLGNGKIEESIGIGYMGLEAALARIDRSRNGGYSSGTTIVKPMPISKSAESLHRVPSHHQEPVPIEPTALPELPPIPRVAAMSRNSSNPDISLREESLIIPPAVDLRYRSSVSHRSLSQMTVSDRGGAHESTIGGGSSRRFINSDLESISRSPATTDTDTLLSDLDMMGMGGEAGKVVRIKADPFTMPRWTPRNALSPNGPDMKPALLAAVRSKQHKTMEQLLDRGVSPDTGPNLQALNEAVFNHDIEGVRLLLLFGADPNAPDKDGLTPLFSAVEGSFVDGAKMLLKYGADPNVSAGPVPESPLGIALHEHKQELTRLLLTYGGDPNHIMNNGNTVLVDTITKSVPKGIVQILLDYGADPNGKNREGQTGLFTAIQAGRVDIVTSLLDHGANPNLPGPKHMLWPATYQPGCLRILLARGADSKKTPGVMELATSINNIESVDILLKAGVDPNSRKDGTYTPLCTSIRDNRADIFALLLSNGADPNYMASEYPAWKCVTHNRVHFLPSLVAAGANLNEPRGILEMAVACDNVEALKYLLDQGVDPNAKTAEGGRTPLTTAIKENKPAIVDLLLRRGADPNIRGQDWPVCMAVRQPVILAKLLPLVRDPRAFKGVVEMAVVAGQLDSVKLLLAAGVSVEDRNGGVFSPLTTAIREDNKEIVRFLLEEGGADIRAPGEHLPIVKAVRRCRGDDTDILEMLLSKGADPNQMYRGWNAIMQAVENGDPKILKLLVANGPVDLQAKDESGRTVVDIATGRGWEEALSILY